MSDPQTAVDALSSLRQWLAAGRERVIALQTRLTALPALAPENGGVGEMAKALAIADELAAMGVTDVQRCDAPDPRVPEGARPNLVARVPGKTSATLWIMGHMDVVPPGDLSLWQSDPWTVRVEGDTLYGRGVEDNQQAVVSMLLLAEALKATGVTPDLGLGLLFVADEECGSQFGMDYVLTQRPDLFAPGDLVVVPDMGAVDGSVVEVAETGILWLKVTVEGRQCHASTPDEGVNSLLATADLILHAAEVAARFPAKDPLFERASTFTPTRHEENVGNVNTVPGRDVFYVDCRILPRYTNAEVLEAFAAVFAPIAARHGVRVSVVPVQDSPAAPTTPVDSPVVRRLCAGIAAELGVTPRCAGVGGGTVAAVFRRAGIPAAVWATQGGSMHQPNENTTTGRVLGDARVFAHLLFAC